METVAGVDGCPGGWVAAVWGGDGVTWRALPLAFGDLLAGLADCAVVAVDVPIGMPETGKRACDLAAKTALGPLRASLFVVPDRIRDATGTVPVREPQPGCALVVEAHPEVSFLRMTERVLPSKKSAPGLAARMLALGEVFWDVPTLLRDAPPAARADDALDAPACAWTARRVLDGDATTLGEAPMVIHA